jgi:mRNA interferase MazF
MALFEQGDVVRVPFPYTDRSTRQRRPALVVSRGGLGEDRRLLWVAMITSAENRSWADDVPFGETYADAGLPAPSVIRPCKLATIESDHAEKVGRVNGDLLERVVGYLQRSITPAARRVASKPD